VVRDRDAALLGGDPLAPAFLATRKRELRAFLRRALEPERRGENPRRR
jgi:hypothetical protein